MTSFYKLAEIDTDDELVLRARRGDALAFNMLLTRHNDLLNHKVDAFRRAPVPATAIYAQAVKIMRHAIDRYQPNSGATFRTYLESNLRLTRFVNKVKNVATIPEHRALLIGRYRTAKSMLTMERDRPPTATELAQYLGWSLTDVEKMEVVLSRKELSSSAMEFDQVGNFSGRFEDSVEMLYFSLTPEEQTVMDYSLGKHGKPKLENVAQISRAANMTPDKVYALKRSLAKKLQQMR